MFAKVESGVVVELNTHNITGEYISCSNLVSVGDSYVSGKFGYENHITDIRSMKISEVSKRRKELELNVFIFNGLKILFDEKTRNAFRTINDTLLNTTLEEIQFKTHDNKFVTLTTEEFSKLYEYCLLRIQKLFQIENRKIQEINNLSIEELYSYNVLKDWDYEYEDLENLLNTQ